MNWDLLIEYAIYFAVIIICVLILLFIKRKNKLPGHTELKSRMENICLQLNELSQKTEQTSREFDFFKKVSRVLYALDRLIYEATLISEKERDVQIGDISALLSRARDEVSPYKYGKKEKEDASGFENAANTVQSAIAIADSILLRDKALRSRKSKSN